MTETTPEFSIPRARLLRAALAPRRTIIAAILLPLFAAAAAAAIILDIRWIIIALMIPLILAPMLLAYLYIDTLLSPRTVPNAFPHTLTFTDTHIRLKAAIPPLPDKTVSPEDCKNTGDCKNTDSPAPAITTQSIPISDIIRIKPGLRDMTLYLKGRPPGLLVIPYAILADPDALLRRLRSR
ncbi:MAG: hypothetical protein J6L73_00490 [Muribaculaceae bacterium]|nr:hypothetical protein [Muribaculaceae bacterium]